MKDSAKNEGSVVLVSGGIDSAALLRLIALRWRLSPVHALTVIYGQKHEREVEMAKKQVSLAEIECHEIVDLSTLAGLFAGGSSLVDPGMAVPDLSDLSADDRRQPSTYVPNRNMILLAVASGYAESKGLNRVYYGAQLTDKYGYWDCTSDFINGMNRVLRLNRRTPVQVFAPFASKSKEDVVRLGAGLGVDFASTWTCYRGRRIPCGSCPSCVERQAAFAGAGIDDPLVTKG
jgi:7-cyano-7-deazaguanine synthase